MARFQLISAREGTWIVILAGRNGNDERWSSPTERFENFGRCLLEELREMAQRGIGGTVIVNVECPPSADVVLSDLAEVSTNLFVPFIRDMLLRLFDESQPGHDGAVLINLFDENTFILKPTIHSMQLSLPNFSGNLGDRGLRHHSALCLSHLTSAVIFVVSKDQRSVSVFQHGKAHLNLDDDQMHNFISNSMLPTEHCFVNSMFSRDGAVNRYDRQLPVRMAGDIDAVESLWRFLPIDEDAKTSDYDENSGQRIVYLGDRGLTVSDAMGHDVITIPLRDDIYLDGFEEWLRHVYGSIVRTWFEEKWANAQGTTTILENCAQAVFENAISRLSLANNLPPHLEADLLSLASVVLLRRFRHFASAPLELQSGEARVEANVYRFSDSSTVIDESLFTSDAFVHSLPAEIQIENIARQLAEFFTTQRWTSGNCIFYVPRDVAHAIGALINELAATRECRLLRKPFGQHLFEYSFSIEDLLRRTAPLWPLKADSDDEMLNAFLELAVLEGLLIPVPGTQMFEFRFE